ncbi:MAG: SprT-like domain-containing protein [Prevotella sp.]|nr:SprT-like domain-containing protein [Prevotella sp.]
MKASVEYLQQKFETYNNLMFGGTLPLLPISIGSARRAMGGLYFKKSRTLFGKTRFSGFKLVVSGQYDLPEDELDDVLIHEMIHYSILYNQQKDSSAHGVLFRAKMNDINNRFGRHISISKRDGLSSASSTAKPSVHYVCVSLFDDGRWGVTCVAKPKVALFRKQLPLAFKLKSSEWWITDDPFFNRFPRVRSLKIFLADKSDLDRHLRSAKKIIFV